jgi:hypothetical protein
VGAGLAGIAAEGAISTIVAAEVGEWNENLSGVGDYAGLEPLAGFSCGGEKLGEFFLVGVDPTAGGLAGERPLRRLMQCGSIKNPS